MFQHTMKLGARNQLKGKIGAGVIVTSSITNEAVDDLGLKTDDEAYATIKASAVTVTKQGWLGGLRAASRF